MKKLYPAFGIIGPLSYALGVIIGGFLLQGYSHMYNSISELTASDVPKIPIIFILFFIYNLSLILFGAGLYSGSEITPTIKVKIVSVMLIIIGVLGAAMLYFVQDPRNAALTFNGRMHLILAIISSLLTMLVILLMGLSLRKDIKFKRFSVYSFVSLIFLFITGGIAAASTANNSNFGGLFERLTIGAFMQWVFVIAVNIFKEANNKTNKTYRSI